jgi:hypothetical protein
LAQMTELGLRRTARSSRIDRFWALELAAAAVRTSPTPTPTAAAGVASRLVRSALVVAGGRDAGGADLSPGLRADRAPARRSATAARAAAGRGRVNQPARAGHRLLHAGQELRLFACFIPPCCADPRPCSCLSRPCSCQKQESADDASQVAAAKGQSACDAAATRSRLPVNRPKREEIPCSAKLDPAGGSRRPAAQGGPKARRTARSMDPTGRGLAP